uniref:Reverse transcriptase domain-containing protein n=1 Tax=Tanacetum cinerariifolium TaxID=118510 RepID=A0A6L2LPL0_TANCI|nr:reverse transcriptase domain-containing protein [Tanacetum cinerariifolium]
MVVKSLSPYNGIIGRPRLKAIQAVPSTVHGMLKFLTEWGIVTICSSLLIPVECTSIGTSFRTPREERTHPTKFTVALHLNFPDQEVVVRGSLSDRGRTELYALLKKNLDIFAWQPSDMTGVPQSVAEHRLNIREGCPPVRQKKREADEEKTTFHVGQGVYCYTKIPFGLKNASATYQRLMDKVFESQMGRNIEVYVDDLVVKSHTEAEMVRDIEETDQAMSGQNNSGTTVTITTNNQRVQSLNGKLASLNKFCWTAKAEQAFQQLKQHLSDLPLLVGPKPQPRTSIKGQILADFLNEIPGNASHGVPVAVTQEEPCTLFTDGSSCIDGSGARLILINPEGVEFTYALRFQFVASNNEAEHEALVVGLRIATQIGVKNVQANVDSKLVANQVLGTYVAKEDNMIKYLEIVKGLVSGFTTFLISQVPWSRNKKADALSKISSTSFAHLSKQVLVEVLETKSITRKEVTAVIEEESPTWMTKLVNYLKEGILPGDEKEARKLRLKAHQYKLMEGVLYKRSFLTPWLRCMGPLQAEYVIREIHEGLCSMHAGPQTVVAKAIRLGYFWLTMHKDTRDMIRKCSDWNRHSRPLSRRAGEGQVPDSRNGLLHEVDRSKGGGNDYRRAGEEIHMGQYCMPLRTKAVIPAEIRMPTYHTTAVDTVNNDDELSLNLDLLKERQELAAMSEAKSKSKMMKYYNARVRGVAFKPRDFVYRSNDASHAVASGKLGPK